eukprot:TRINITY_DN10648_c0_g1_i1.p1 TRINITY_DN10648_c0_g1~~TRINITY_DN10648_c0_g1_i1.p1  ORF type:complete len:506 (-),score=65.14 TRINITY_DN10648_c0_g1_i1:88-1605(-)
MSARWAVRSRGNKAACGAVAQSPSPPEFGAAAELPALSVCRLEAREDLLRKLRQRLDDPALADFSCPICWEPFWQPVRTVCGHAFCEGCLLKSVLAQLSQEHPDVSCPMCRTPLHVDDVTADQALLTRIMMVVAERRREEENTANSARRGNSMGGRICRGLVTTRATTPLSGAGEGNCGSGSSQSRPGKSHGDGQVARSLRTGTPFVPPQGFEIFSRPGTSKSGGGGASEDLQCTGRPCTPTTSCLASSPIGPESGASSARGTPMLAGWLRVAPSRPGTSGRPSRPGTSGLPSRPGAAGLHSRPGTSGLPARPCTSGLPARPGTSGLPARPGTSGLPSTAISAKLSSSLAHPRPSPSPRVAPGSAPGGPRCRKPHVAAAEDETAAAERLPELQGTPQLSPQSPRGHSAPQQGRPPDELGQSQAGPARAIHRYASSAAAAQSARRKQGQGATQVARPAKQKDATEAAMPEVSMCSEGSAANTVAHAPYEAEFALAERLRQHLESSL